MSGYGINPYYAPGLADYNNGAYGDMSLLVDMNVLGPAPPPPHGSMLGPAPSLMEFPGPYYWVGPPSGSLLPAPPPPPLPPLSASSSLGLSSSTSIGTGLGLTSYLQVQPPPSSVAPFERHNSAAQSITSLSAAGSPDTVGDSDAESAAAAAAAAAAAVSSAPATAAAAAAAAAATYNAYGSLPPLHQHFQQQQAMAPPFVDLGMPTVASHVPSMPLDGDLDTNVLPPSTIFATNTPPTTAIGVTVNTTTATTRGKRSSSKRKAKYNSGYDDDNDEDFVADDQGDDDEDYDGSEEGRGRGRGRRSQQRRPPSAKRPTIMAAAREGQMRLYAATHYVGRKGSIDNLSSQKATISSREHTIKQTTVFVAGSAFFHERDAGTRGPMKRTRLALGYESNKAKLSQPACYVVELQDRQGDSQLWYSEVFLLTGHSRSSLPGGLGLSREPPAAEDFENVCMAGSSRPIDSQQREDILATIALLQQLVAGTLTPLEAEQQAWTAAIAQAARRRGIYSEASAAAMAPIYPAIPQRQQQ